MEDLVNHPPHYQLIPEKDVEVIDVIKAVLTPEEYQGYLKGNSIKYILRADVKGKPVEDREKCQWYMRRIK